jgi:protein O-GlcNAc transferase
VLPLNFYNRTCLVALFLVSACVSAPSPNSERGQAIKHYDKAVAFYAKGLYQDAIEEYHLAVQDWPNYQEAHFGLGVAFIKTGFYRGAVLALQRAIELKPESPDAMLNLGIAHAALGRYSDAVSSYEASLAQDPAAGAWYPLGVAHAAIGNQTASLEAYRRATASAPYEANTALAGHYRSVGDISNALVHLLAAAEADLSRFEPWTGIGELHEAESAHLKAAEAYERALTLKTDHPGLPQKLAAVYSLAGLHEKAVVHYEAAAVVTPHNAQAVYNLAVSYDALGRHQEAIDRYRQSVQLQPDFADAHLNLAIDLMGKQDFAGALTAYEAYLSHAPSNARRDEVESIVAKLQAALAR